VICGVDISGGANVRAGRSKTCVSSNQVSALEERAAIQVDIARHGCHVAPMQGWRFFSLLSASAVSVLEGRVFPLLQQYSCCRLSESGGCRTKQSISQVVDGLRQGKFSASSSCNCGVSGVHGQIVVICAACESLLRQQRHIVWENGTGVVVAGMRQQR